jgi:signal transduction histidine kinase
MALPSIGDGLAVWIRGLSVPPSGERDWVERVCRPLSQGLGDVGVWLELPTGLRSGIPRFPDKDFRNGNGASLAWTVRRSLFEGRQVFWVEMGAPGGLLGFSCTPEQVREQGSQKIEAWLLASSMHLIRLLEKTELATQLELRERFLAIASHELKTPLTAIYGMVQLQERLLRSKPWSQAIEELRAEQERHLSFARIILKQVERLNALIDGLLDLSRIRAGRFSVEPIPVDAARAIRELAEGRLEPLAQEAGVELLLDVPERLPARLDPLRFDEVVTNLVVQALRRSPEGGQIRLRAWADPEGGVILRVVDQGGLVEPQSRERCFEPFSIEVGGLGLGLYLSRQIARLHAGDVRFVDPGAGRGAAARGNEIEATFRALPISVAPGPRPDMPPS